MYINSKVQFFKIAISFLTFSTLIFITSSALANKTCIDDVRLANIASLLQNKESINPPLSMTDESFVLLNPKFRRELAKNIVICGKTPLNSSGKPILPRHADFFAIWEKIDISIAKEDWAEVEFIHKSFTAKPLPISVIHSLLTFPPYNTQKLQKLAEVLGIYNFNPKQLNISDQIRHDMLHGENHNEKHKIFVADIFKAFKGKVDKETTIALISELRELPKAQTRAEALGQELNYLLIDNSMFEEATITLSALGINAIPLEQYFKINN